MQKQPPPEGKDDGIEDATALHWAARKGYPELIELLLQSGEFPVDAIDDYQWTPLHWAIRNGHVDCVQTLLGFGAVPSMKTSAPKTALQIAQMKNNQQILSLLTNRSPPEGSNIATKPHPTLNKAQRGSLIEKLMDLEKRSIAVEKGNRAAESKQKDFTEKLAFVKESSDKLGQKNQEWKKREKELQERETAKKEFEEQNRPGSEISQVIMTIPWSELELLEQLGTGSFATVYKADWRGDLVAVKKIRENDASTPEEKKELVDSFNRETYILSQLRHTNIVLLMAACIEPSNLAIVTELMDGGTLHGLLNGGGDISWTDRVGIALDIARGMNYLHNLKPAVVHRDLKSQNILLDNTGRAKVCDMGLTRVKEHTLIHTKAAAGTPAWMAPECLRGEEFDEKSDVFSFGVILWEMMMRKVPWEGASALDVVSRVGFSGERLRLPRFPPPGCPPAFLQMAHECMEEEQFERPRFSTIMTQLTEMLEELELLEEETQEGDDDTEEEEVRPEEEEASSSSDLVPDGSADNIGTAGADGGSATKSNIDVDELFATYSYKSF